MPICARSERTVRSRTSTPSSVNATGVDVVESRNQIDQRALADAAHADHRDHLPGFDGQIDALQDRRVGVGKINVTKLDFFANGFASLASGLSSIAGFSSNISKTRSAPARP